MNAPEPECHSCLDTGYVCEDHPDRPWEGVTGPNPAACGCGWGMPCPACCEPAPADGTGNIGDAFVPRARRTEG